jgi:hypothetical protein
VSIIVIHCVYYCDTLCLLLYVYIHTFVVSLLQPEGDSGHLCKLCRCGFEVLVAVGDTRCSLEGVCMCVYVYVCVCVCVCVCMYVCMCMCYVC